MPGLHAKLSPSSSDKWINCPGYLGLLERVQELFGEEESSEAAEWGTKAHEVAQRALESRNPTRALRNMTGVDIETKAVVEYYVDVIEDYLDQLEGAELHYQIYVEERLDAKEAGVPLYGTADCIIVHDDGLVVVDFKTGKHVRVDPDDSQLKVYGYLAAEKYLDPWKVGQTVELVIVQPRYAEKDVPLVRTYCVDSQDLNKEMEPLLLPITNPSISGGRENDFVPGDHCRFCYAKPLCPKKEELIVSILEKGDLDTEEKLKFVLDNKQEISNILKRATALAISGLEKGSIDAQKLQYGLKKSVGNRAWNHSGDKNMATLLRKHGVSKDEVWQRTLISPAQARKRVDDKEWLDRYIIRPEKGHTLVPLGEADESLHGCVAKELAAFEPVEEEAEETKETKETNFELEDF